MVVVVCPVILSTNEFVHVPVDVTVICVAESLTDTDFPANNSDFVAVLGVTVPTSAVRLKFGPKLTPSPLFNIIVVFTYNIYFLFFFLIYGQLYVPHAGKSLTLFIAVIIPFDTVMICAVVGG